MKKSEVAKILTYLLADYGESVTPEKLELWSDQLQDVSLVEAWETARLLARSQVYGKPKVSDFHGVLDELRKAKDPEDISAEEAFRYIMNCAKSMGRSRTKEVYEDVGNLSQIARQALIRIGFLRFCENTISSEGFLLRDFKVAFEEAASRKNYSRKNLGFLNLNAENETARIEGRKSDLEKIGNVQVLGQMLGIPNKEQEH